jgi:hypothetical protein
MPPIMTAASLSQGHQYAAAASGLITILFGLRAHFMPQTHFRGLGIDSISSRDIITTRAGGHAIGVRTAGMGALIVVGAYEGSAIMTGWLMAGMVAVLAVDGVATKQAVRSLEEDEKKAGKGPRGVQKGMGKEWLHWSSVPLFGAQAVLCLGRAYGWL